jgi:hypothetical protein
MNRKYTEDKLPEYLRKAVWFYNPEIFRSAGYFLKIKEWKPVTIIRKDKIIKPCK